MSPIREKDIQIKVYFDQIGNTVDRNIYGQFIEHLWTGIYDGIWVGPDSSIPNEDGIRLDTVEALTAIMPPIVSMDKNILIKFTIGVLVMNHTGCILRMSTSNDIVCGKCL